jgi:hypothetical protein
MAVDFRATACPRCGFVMRGTALPAVAGSRTAKKSPRTAMWITLSWPGAGHLYAGIHRTGTILCFASVVLFALSLTLIGPLVGLVAWLTLSLYAAIDVGKTLTS